jgi:hypothetical protein
LRRGRKEGPRALHGRRSDAERRKEGGWRKKEGRRKKEHIKGRTMIVTDSMIPENWEVGSGCFMWADEWPKTGVKWVRDL